MSTIKTRLCFYGGLRTIGGTKVVIEYGDDRVILDFGMSYNPRGSIFSGIIKPRPHSMVSDYLKLGMLPPINGIYPGANLSGITQTENHLKFLKEDLVPVDDYHGNSAVFISHLHLDHMSAMGFISPRIPVYMTEDSLQLYQVLDTIGEGVGGKRSYLSCRYNEPVCIGVIEIIPVRVDHDVPGAAGYLVKTPDCKIAYTGDLRLHGNHPEWTMNFIEAVRAANVDILIIETTTINDEVDIPFQDSDLETIGENSIPEKTAVMLEQTAGLGIFNVYHRNLERLAGLIEAASQAGRNTVLEPATAYLALELLPETGFYVYANQEIKEKQRENNLTDWQKKLFKEKNIIASKIINQKPGKYFLQNSYVNCLELLDFNLRDSVYIHSGGIPLGEFDPEYQRLQAFLKHLNVDYQMIESSGHATPHHLQYIVDEIDPPVLIPLHGFNPAKLKAKNGDQFLPEEGESYNYTSLCN